jgi:hypothetical protein
MPGREATMRRFVPIVALVTLGVLLGTPACGRSGPPPLTNTEYWRGKLSRGEGMDDVVAQGKAAIPLIRSLLKDRNLNVVEAGGRVANQIGESVAVVVPDLIDALKRDPTLPNVKQALKKMKDSSVEYLVPLLKRNDKAEQEIAIDALNGIGAPAADAVDPLMKIIEDPNTPTGLKRKALVTLGSIGTPGEKVMDRLRKIYDEGGPLKNDVAMCMKRIRTAKKVRDKGGDK